MSTLLNAVGEAVDNRIKNKEPRHGREWEKFGKSKIWHDDPSKEQKIILPFWKGAPKPFTFANKQQKGQWHIHKQKDKQSFYTAAHTEE